MHITHLQINVAGPCAMHVHNEHAKRHLCTRTKIHTHTRLSDRTYSRVYMGVCTCEYVRPK